MSRGKPGTLWGTQRSRGQEDFRGHGILPEQIVIGHLTLEQAFHRGINGNKVISAPVETVMSPVARVGG